LRPEKRPVLSKTPLTICDTTNNAKIDWHVHH
jgi:hypothetical protein